MEARSGRLARKNAAFEVKAEGNERFRNGRLRSALECYEEAVRMDPSEPVYYANRSTCLFELGEYAASCEDSKQATMLYRDKQKIGMISRTEANNAVGKLLRQSARCFLCMNSTESLEAAKSLLARCIEIHPDPDAELLSMHAGAVQAVEEAYSAGAGEGSGPAHYMVTAKAAGGGSCDFLPRYRSPVMNTSTPYSCIGWECALSGLAGRVPSPADTESPFSNHGGTFGEDEDDGAIDLLSRPEGERSLSLLFGGLGDARQLLATFRDIYQQVEKSRGGLRYEGMGLDLLMNDVKAECLARTIVMLRALEELGRALKEAGERVGGEMMMGEGEEGGVVDPLELLEQSEAVSVAVYRCYHLYLGAFLMPHEAEWLQATLEELSATGGDSSSTSASPTSSSSSSFGFPWLSIRAPKAAQAVKGVVDRWRVMCKTMDPQVMAKIYQSSMKRPDEKEEEGEEQPHDHEHHHHHRHAPAMNGQTNGATGGEGGGGEHIPDQQEAECECMERQWRNQVREAMIEQITHMSDDEIDQMREAEGTTAAEKRAFLQAHWANDVDPRTLDLMRHLPSAHREIDFFHTTMLLPVPPPQCARGLGLMDKAQGSALHKLWRPNVTLVSSDSPLEVLAGQLDDDAVARSLTALTFCPFKSLKLLLMSPGDENILPRQEAYRSAAVFFSEVALGLVGFLEAGTLRAELFLGDVHDLGNTLPGESLDRVLISNVPDYTTLLPSMIKLTPLLKLVPGAALKHSVLKFNASFHDLPEFAHSMGLYVPDMASLPLYLGVNHEYGGIWAHLVEWSRAVPSAMMMEEGEEGAEDGEMDGRQHEGSVARIDGEKIVNAHSAKDLAMLHQHLPPAPDVQAWLATVFLSIAMPLARDAVGTKTEIRPLTLHAFFELCHYLLSHMDFPPHNLAWVIEHAMRGELKTAAVPPDATPWSPHYTWRQVHHLTRSVPTGAFALETRTLAGLWQRKLGLRLCAPLGTKLPQPEDVTQLRLTLPEVEEARFKLTGYPLAKVVGVCLLSPEFMMEHTEALDPANYALPVSASSSRSSSFSSSPPSKNGEMEEGDKGLRPLLLKYDTQRSGKVHLFSCVRWDSQTSLVTLLLPKADLRELVDRGYHLILLRTDSWHPLTRPFPLSDEQVAGEEAMEICHAFASSSGGSILVGEGQGQEEGGGGAAAAHIHMEGASAASSAGGVEGGAGGAGGEGLGTKTGTDYHMHKTNTF